MTIINPKSIAGVTSITTPSGSDNLFTVHTNNTTERIRINNDGDVIVGSGITVSPDGDIFTTGVTTSTTFVGALTGNVTGNATGLSGTPNISAGTIAGSTGTFTGDVDIADKIVHTGDTNTAIRFPSADTITTETGGSERTRIDSTGRVRIGCTAQPSTTVSGYQFDGGGYHALRISQGGGTSGTDSSGVTVYGGGSSTTVGASAAMGASLNLINTNNTDNNQNSVNFSNSNSLSVATVIGRNDSHSSRNGSLIFATSSAAAPAERFRINSSGQLIQRYSADPYDNRAATFQSASGVTSTYIAIVNTESNGQCGVLFGDHAGQNSGNFDGYINYDHSNSSMQFLVSGGSERMRINSSGQMMLGTTSPGGLSSSRLFQIQSGSHSTVGMQILMTANDDNPASIDLGKSRSTGNAILGNNDDVGQINFFGNDGSGFHSMARIMCSAQGHDTSSDDLPSKLRFFTLKENSTTLRERLTIDDEGIISTNSENHGFNVSTTVSAGTNKYNIRGHHSGTVGSTGSGTISFTVWSNGNVENTNNSYGQISDETLKQDIVDASSQWNDIKNITVRKFRFKDNPTGELQIGVVAQEVEKVSAGLVYETGDVGEEVKAVKYSVLYMKAIKALQESMTRIEVLETRLNNAGIAT